MKIGIIYCCYGNPEYIDDCLAPWIEAKKTNDILIAAVHGQFKEYHDLGIEDNDFQVQQELIGNTQVGYIDYLYLQNQQWLKDFSPIYQSEAEIRDKGLQWLLKQNCDYVWLLDNDEFYTVEQINSIIGYLTKEPFITWFSIPFKNYIFDGRQWIDGFCPPRIFARTKGDMAGCTLQSFYWDNDIMYELWGDTRQLECTYKSLSNKSIPKNIILGGIKHLTWLHTNGKLKYEYQMKHFGHCGYKWNYDTNEIELNKEFYTRNNLSLPDIKYEY